MRVRCWDSAHFAAEGKNSAVGYAGRRKSLDHIASGGRAYVVMSAPPSSLALGPGVWAPHANLDAYPVVTVENTDNGDIFVNVGRPVAMSAI
jgi:orotidine-5'-phosphate decarboxylase